MSWENLKYAAVLLWDAVPFWLQFIALMGGTIFGLYVLYVLGGLAGMTLYWLFALSPSKAAKAELQRIKELNRPEPDEPKMGY